MANKPTTDRKSLLETLRESNLTRYTTVHDWLVANDACTEAIDDYHTLTLANRIMAILMEYTTRHDDAFMYSTVPSESETVEGRLAYYATDDKFLKNIRTPIKVRRYLAKFPDLARNPERLEHAAARLDELLQPTDKYDIRIFGSDDMDGWRAAYHDNTNVRSCMAQEGMGSSTYGVSKHETYRCYVTQHYDLPDNGLKLATLWQSDQVVARAITFELDGDNCYVRCYGDSRLERWLSDNGYRCVSRMPVGTILAAISLSEDEYLHPYVDGGNDHADLCYHPDARQHYWELDGGEYNLSDASGVISLGSDETGCEHCGTGFDAEAEGGYIEDLNRIGYSLCGNCYTEHTYIVDDETVYEPNIDDLLGSRVWQHLEGGYVTQNGMADNDLVPLADTGTAVSIDDAVYVESQDQWYYEHDCVYVEDYEQLGWDGVYVTKYAYERGILLPYREVNYEGDAPLGEWRHNPDIVCFTPVGDVALHDADAIVVHHSRYRHTNYGGLSYLPSTEAVSEYPELTAAADINYRYMQELGVWRNSALPKSSAVPVSDDIGHIADTVSYSMANAAVIMFY